MVWGASLTRLLNRARCGNSGCLVAPPTCIDIAQIGWELGRGCTRYHPYSRLNPPIPLFLSLSLYLPPTPFSHTSHLFSPILHLLRIAISILDRRRRR